MGWPAAKPLLYFTVTVKPILYFQSCLNFSISAKLGSHPQTYCAVLLSSVEYVISPGVLAVEPLALWNRSPSDNFPVPSAPLPSAPRLNNCTLFTVLTPLFTSSLTSLTVHYIVEEDGCGEEPGPAWSRVPAALRTGGV